MTEMLKKEFSRKTFLRGSGALVIGFSLAGAGLAGKASAAGPTAAGYMPDATQVDSWLTIGADNTVTVKTSQIEVGQGVTTGLLMLAAEELDVSLAQMRYSPSDTWAVVNSGSTGGSTGIQSSGGPKLRAAAALAKQTLLSLASKSLGVPVSSLSVSNGVVSGGGKSISYGELVGGKLLSTKMSPATLNPGQSPAKPVAQYGLVTNRMPRIDIPDKVTGRYTYVHNIRVPGMVHGRVVRPRGQGAFGTGSKILAVDESSIKKIPNVQIVRKGDFLGVVADREYDAIQAAAQLKVTWQDDPILPSSGNLWQRMREQDAAGLTRTDVPLNIGNVEAGLKASAKTISATYHYGNGGRAVIGPSCAVADVKPDSAVIFTNVQAIHNTGIAVAKMLDLPPAQVRVLRYEGASSFGSAQFLAAAQAAALMSQTIGKPVRVQFMRWDEHGWDNFQAAQMTDMRGGIDGNGKIVAYDYTVFAQPYSTDGFSNSPTLVEEQLRGTPAAVNGLAKANDPSAGEAYDVANKRWTGKTMPVLKGYFRTGSLRSGGEGQLAAFAAEQFVDELAYAAGMDPIEFRRNNITDERWLTAMNAVASAAKWTPRVAASNLSSANVVTGRGYGAGRHGSAGYSTAIAEIEVNKKTGKITVTHLYNAADHGLVVNPEGVENQMVGASIMGVSRALHEEVLFSKTRVTGLDWVTYPILRFKDAPTLTNVVLQRPDKLPLGAGEGPITPVPAAIANAFFDATGVRIRHAPMTPARVRAVLGAAGK
jgi:nicotinate dehydrogenase subunit B